MSLLAAIILGGLVGWAAAHLLGRDSGIISSIIIGIIGSFIGSIVSNLLTGTDQSFLAFNWTGLIWALVGAIILVAVINAFSNRHHRTAA